MVKLWQMVMSVGDKINAQGMCPIWIYEASFFKTFFGGEGDIYLSYSCIKHEFNAHC